MIFYPMYDVCCSIYEIANYAKVTSFSLPVSPISSIVCDYSYDPAKEIRQIHTDVDTEYVKVLQSGERFIYKFVI